MPEPAFETFRAELLESGVAPRQVRRLIAELTDHAHDLRHEALQRGLSADEAAISSARRLGDLERIVADVAQRAELRSWVYRYPRIARLYLPVAYALVLPVAPLFAGSGNAAEVLRWGVALMLSAGVTAAMLLSMQLAIAFT